MLVSGWILSAKWECRVRGSEDDQRRYEDANGEGEQECWFGEGGCLELSEMESGSWRDCC